MNSKINTKNVFVLNPFYRLRPDKRRAIIYSRNGEEDSFSHDWCSCIHPFHAVMLSFFTQNRTLGENIHLLSEYFFQPETEITTWLLTFLNNPKPIRFQSRLGIIHFPKKVLIPIEEVIGAYPFRVISLNDYIWSHLDLSTRRLYAGPLQVTFMLDNRCETHCKYCYADTETPIPNPLPTKRIMELIDEAAQIPVCRVNLMGGEVFLHPEWDLILKKLVQLDLAPDFLSTKIPPDGALIERLRATGFQGVLQISLDAIDANVLRKSIGATEDYVRRMKNGLKMLDQSNIHYQVSTVLTRYNGTTDVLLSLYEELTKLQNLKDWRIVPVSYSSTKEVGLFQQIRLPKKEVLALFDKIANRISLGNSFPVIMGREVVNKEYYQAEGGSRHFKGKECSALTNHIFVLPDGKVTICEQLYWITQFIIGDVSSSSLLDVWNSQKAMSLWKISRDQLNDGSPCKQCSLFEDCYGYQNRCWSDIVKAYGQEHWDYPDPRCKFAPKMINKIC